MFAPSKWQADEIAEVEINFPGLGRSPGQGVLAGWVAALIIGIAALAASVL